MDVSYLKIILIYNTYFEQENFIMAIIRRFPQQEIG